MASVNQYRLDGLWLRELICRLAVHYVVNWDNELRTMRDETMPTCFDVTRNGETSPTSLNKIDEELCSILGVPVDPVRYVGGWFDYIGLRLACGSSFADIHSELCDKIDATEEKPVAIRAFYVTLRLINTHLARNFKVNAR